jgi:YVTN family beta-propeller protein
MKVCRSIFFLFFLIHIDLPAFADTLVVLNKAEATASLIDLRNGRVVAKVPTGSGPHEAAASPDGKYVLASNYGTRESPGRTLTVIDVPAMRSVKTIHLGEYNKPHGVRWLKDGRTALVTAEANKALLIIDVFQGTVKHAIPTNQEISHMVVATPDEKFAFVANIGSGTLTVIDLVNAKYVKDIATGKGAEGIDITPNGQQLWVTNREADTVSIIDPQKLKVTATLDAKSFPIRAKCTPDGKHALISNARSSDIAVFDTRSKKVLRRIKIPLEASDTKGRLFNSQFGSSSVPIGIVIHPDGKKAYVANANADAISVIDLESWNTTGVLKAGKEPDGMAYSSLNLSDQ